MDEHKESLGLTSRIYATRSAEDGLAHVDLNRNVEALIENPLAHLTPEQLLRDVRDFARANHLEEHVELLKKGAQVAKDPRFYEAIRGITETEKQALRDEEYRRFKQPIALYLTIITCSVGAAVQGWDQTGSNGANLDWPNVFGLDTTAGSSSRGAWLFGLVNAAPYFAAAFIGCWFSHPLNHRSAFTQTWQQLFACRLLLGIGIGTKASTIPVFAAENSPASIRGSLVMGWQLWVSFGIFMGSSANLAVYQVGKIAWRLQLGSAFIPAVPLLIGIYLCPESPRWYIKKHRYNDAFRSLQRLRNTPLQAARDLYYIHAQVRLEEIMLGDGDIQKMNLENGKEHFTNRGRYLARFVQLFTIARVRRATLAAFVVMIAQQMCGSELTSSHDTSTKITNIAVVNIMAFYATTLFKDAHATVRTIDTFGRRALLLVTFPNMAWTLLAAAFCFKIPNKSPAHLPVLALFIYLFTAFYSPGEGPVPFTYSAEAFPLFHRGTRDISPFSHVPTNWN
ncbi:hypothetical protein HO133_008928 [Letharia lupina]|uniref:Major facilitator superfamily (MFS) profile domain-containing protein n=1 Tax=Letharia lupina TaxID=560253 RepID=A0A8H6CM63_9LECA|nr:uncharacterized protein HO133_008928 [Letharia lupina]KAF6226064.1 hypothetical protein HO133_008928 [Letharia lupina]